MSILERVPRISGQVFGRKLVLFFIQCSSRSDTFVVAFTRAIGPIVVMLMCACCSTNDWPPMSACIVINS